MSLIGQSFTSLDFNAQITGGGAGGNLGLEMSNGWLLAVSVSDFLNSNFQSIESGVHPDVSIENEQEHILSGEDVMLQQAINIIRS